MEQVRVGICALDPITQAGVGNCVDARPDMVVVPEPRRAGVDVLVAAFDRMSTGAVSMLRAQAAEVGKPIVLVINDIKEEELITAVDCRVVTILPRAAATDDRLHRAIGVAAAGEADIPPNLLGRLIEHTERLHREVLEPNGLDNRNLSNREIDVLRLMADGFDTGEIARNLSYSERTVKNIIYAITTRLRLRNRSHAVAYAVRAGVI